jgi:hypothetical protein
MYNQEYNARATRLVFKHNITFAGPNQLALEFYTLQSNVTHFSTAARIDSNYHMRPSNEDGIFGEALSNKWTYYSLREWVARTGFESHSFSTPTGINTKVAELFFYNPTTSNSTRALTGTWKDARGRLYTGSVVIPPYSSLILLKNNVDIRR